MGLGGGLAQGLGGRGGGGCNRHGGYTSRAQDLLARCCALQCECAWGRGGDGRHFCWWWAVRGAGNGGCRPLAKRTITPPENPVAAAEGGGGWGGGQSRRAIPVVVEEHTGGGLWGGVPLPADADRARGEGGRAFLGTRHLPHAVNMSPADEKEAGQHCVITVVHGNRVACSNSGRGLNLFFFHQKASSIAPPPRPRAPLPLLHRTPHIQPEMPSSFTVPHLFLH